MDDLIFHSSDMGTFAEHVLQNAIVFSSETLKNVHTGNDLFDSLVWSVGL